MTRAEAVRMIAMKINDHEENGHCAYFDEPDEMDALNMAFYALKDNSKIDCVLEIIDTAQTYKMFEGQEETYLDKRVLRDAVQALKGGKE